MRALAGSVPAMALRISLVPMAAVALLALVAQGAGLSLQFAAVNGLILMIAVIGLYVFMGNSGVISFGHVAFAAAGAYVGGLLSMNAAQKMMQMPDLPGWLARIELPAALAVLAGGVAAMLLALPIVAPIVRLSGLAAGLATFSVLVVANVVIANWESITRGRQGLNGVPGDAVQAPVQILPWILFAILAAAFFQSSRSGLRLRASREDEPAARAVGVNVARDRAVAFLLSAFITGIAGALYGQSLGTFGPDAFYLSLTFQVISMLIIGGMTSLFGAVLGAGVVTTLTEVLLRFEEAGGITNLASLGLAAATLLILILRPSGITGGREATMRYRRRPGSTKELTLETGSVTRDSEPDS